MLAGCLALLACGLAAEDTPLRDKTLVAWVSPSTLDQRAGSVLTLDDRKKHFDGIVFAEVAPRRWMAGSEFLLRTQQDQAASPEETVSDGKGLVQVAIVYRGRQVQVLRDGKPYASYEYDASKGPAEFGPGTWVVVGMRHLNADKARFAGAIDDIRVYAEPLSAEQVAALRPNEASGPAPWAWWSFDDGPKERTGRFAATGLVQGAKVEGGRLLLDGKEAAMLAADTMEELEAVVPLGPVVPAEEIETVRNFRNRLLADPHRPAYHFTIPEDYAMPFDPNGAIYWKGRYHLFYIYQERGVHVFGHVSSLDMVHWRHHPPALFPTPDSPEKGIFSGNCFVNKDGEATMVYHGVGAGNCMATSTDDLLDHWKKLPTNPFVPEASPHAPYRAWDPYGWLEGDTYYAISGWNRAGLFKAKGLDDKWAYVGDFLHHTVPGVDLREDISCADFFQLGGKRVLVCISHRLGTRYYVGEWKDEQFHPEVHERMSWVDNLYFAPESLEGPGGRRVMWAWIFDRRNATQRASSGWSGEMALPRELTLGPDDRLRMKPIDELKQLRYGEKSSGPFELAAGATHVLEGVSGDALELLIEVEPRGAKKVGVVVRRSPDGAEGVPVAIDVERKKLVVGEEAGPFSPEGETVALRVFVDRSVVEAFADDRQAALRRTYPRRADSLGVSLFAEGGPATIRRVVSWKMFPSNPY